MCTDILSFLKVFCLHGYELREVTIWVPLFKKKHTCIWEARLWESTGSWTTATTTHSLYNWDKDMKIYTPRHQQQIQPSGLWAKGSLYWKNRGTRHNNVSFIYWDARTDVTSHTDVMSYKHCKRKNTSIYFNKCLIHNCTGTHKHNSCGHKHPHKHKDSDNSSASLSVELHNLIAV